MERIDVLGDQEAGKRLLIPELGVLGFGHGLSVGRCDVDVP